MGTAVGTGTATITATSEGQSAGGTVKVDTRTGFLTAIVDSVRQAYDFPALAATSVTRDGGTFGMAAAGRRRVSLNIPVTTSDHWHIGSNLKAITAHVAGIAVHAGAISWTTTLEQAYPEFAGTMRPEYKNVTLRQLLGHLGGIIPNVNNPAVPGGGSLTSQRANIAGWATSLAPTGAVGSYTYSNVGFMIAANMVERAMAMPWEDVMQTRLLAPLGITGFGWGAAPFGPNQNPIGHQYSGGTWVEWPGLDNPPYLSAAGRTHWTLEGWGKVIQEIMRADQGQSVLVSQAVTRVNTTAQITTGPGAGSASGAFVTGGNWTAGGRAVTHDGSNTVNFARFQIALDRGVAVLTVANGDDPVPGRSNNAMAALSNRLWVYYDRHR